MKTCVVIRYWNCRDEETVLMMGHKISFDGEEYKSIPDLSVLPPSFLMH